MRFSLLLLAAALAPELAFAQVEPVAPIEGAIEAYSLEDLMNQEITSVSKKDEKLIGAAAAVYVVRAEDIRRSGARNIPDALRMVPGIQVGHLTPNFYTVSSRGFADVTANKLLVLIDGRSVYSLLFSGVLWDIQDVLLEDIDRIEVIRGPGGTLWGANAVNGIINIVTKEASGSWGLMAMAGAGTSDRAFGGLRYGGRLPGDVDYKVYLKAFDWNPIEQANDDWHQYRAGARADWHPNGADHLTLQGDYYRGDADLTMVEPLLTAPYVHDVPGPAAVSGANVIARWTHTFSPESVLILQAYYDRTDRLGPTFGEDRDTVDLEFQHRFGWFDRHQIMWGLGARLTRDHVTNSFAITYLPARVVQRFASAFLQDEIAFADERLKLTFGAKIEHNPFTGFEYQPNARIGVVPGDRHGLWAAVSRAVRMPSRAEHHVRLNRVVTPANPPLLIAVFGRPGFRSEVLWAGEAGYRLQPIDPLTFDLTAYYDSYRHLRSLESGEPFREETPEPAHIVVPLVAHNRMSARVYGFEANAKWQAATWARFELTYSYLDMNLQPLSSSSDSTSKRSEGQSPPHQLGLRGSFDLPWKLELDGIFRYVDELPTLGLPAYGQLDVRLGWRPNRSWEVALVGQNLLHHHLTEYNATTLLTARSVEVYRAVYLSLTFRR